MTTKVIFKTDPRSFKKKPKPIKIWASDKSIFGDVTISMLKHIVILSVVSEYERSRRIYSAQINAADNVFADFSTSNG